MKYEILEHTADVKFRAFGKTINEVFENAILAFSDCLSRGEKVFSRKGKVLNVSGSDKENLLYNFLEELIFLLETENFVVAKGSVFVRGNNLRAEVYGDDVGNCGSLIDIKAATYSEMYVKETDNGWELQAVLDI